MEIEIESKESAEKRQTSNTNKYLIKFILLMFMYSINAVQFSSIPILFYRSKLVCLNEKGDEYDCSVEEACSNSNGYTQKSEYSQIYNLTMQLDLYCDRELLEAWIFTFANFGRIVANIILILMPFQKHQKVTNFYTSKEIYINVSSVITGIALLSLYLEHTINMFVAVLFVWYFSSAFFYGLIFSHIQEQYPEQFQKYGAAYLNNSTPFMMVIFIIFTFNFGSWQNTLIHFTGIPLLLIGLLSVYLQRKLVLNSTSSTNSSTSYNIFENTIESDQNQDSSTQKIEGKNQSNLNSQNGQEIVNVNKQNKKQSQYDDLEDVEQSDQQTQDGETASKKSTTEDANSKNINNKKLSFFKNIIEKYFPFMNRDANLRRNFYLWSLGFSSYVMNYYGVCFLLNQLQGNLFFNCLLSTLFELLSNFIATTLVVKYNNQLKKLIIIIQTITGLAFMSAFFISDTKDSLDQYQNQEMGLKEVLSLIIYLSPIIVAKISFEITPSLLLSYQKSVIPVKFLQSQYSCSNIITMILSNIVPFYKYFLQQIGINPFIGFGLFTLFSAYQSKHYVVINKDKAQNSDEI